jgi:hypothetical protein
MLLLTACGRASNQANQSTDNTSVISSHDNEAFTTQAAQTTDHVLTVLARSTYAGPIHQAEQALIAEWAQRPDKEGHTFRVELTTFHPNDELNQLTRLDTMLMAGQAYDIFFPVADHRHIREYALSGFVTDFYPLIDNCPRTDIDDFFTNALTAWEVDGGLYTFPWDFGFSYAFINSDLPREIVDSFTLLDTVSIAQLVDIYQALLLHHDEAFENFNFSHGYTLHHPSRVIASYMSNFIDFENRIANFTDAEFTTFLANFSEVFDGRHLETQENPHWTNWWGISGQGWQFVSGPYFDRHSLRMIARGSNSFTWGPPRGGHNHNRWEDILNIQMQPHAFIVESRGLYPSAAIVHENVFSPYFEHGIPLVDDAGHLLIADNTAYPSGISISAGTNGAVAWDFSRHLLHAFNQIIMFDRPIHFYRYTLDIPIIRDLAPFRLEQSIYDAYSIHFDWHMFSDEFTTILFRYSAGLDGRTASNPYGYITEVPLMAAQLVALAEMPMALAHPPIPDFLYIDNLELLLRGLITPQDFAQRTQNAVSLWLIGG